MSISTASFSPPNPYDDAQALCVCAPDADAGAHAATESVFEAAPNAQGELGRMPSTRHTTPLDSAEINMTEQTPTSWLDNEVSGRIQWARGTAKAAADYAAAKAPLIERRPHRIKTRTGTILTEFILEQTRPRLAQPLPTEVQDEIGKLGGEVDQLIDQIHETVGANAQERKSQAGLLIGVATEAEAAAHKAIDIAKGAKPPAATETEDATNDRSIIPLIGIGLLTGAAAWHAAQALGQFAGTLLLGSTNAALIFTNKASLEDPPKPQA